MAPARIRSTKKHRHDVLRKPANGTTTSRLLKETKTLSQPNAPTVTSTSPLKPFRFDKDPPRRLQLNDFECIKFLGHGGFGSVLLVRIRDSDRAAENYEGIIGPVGKLYAMKIARKREIRNYENEEGPGKPEIVDQKNIERRTLVRLPWNPFVCGLVDVFNDSRNLYYSLEYGPGGSLGSFMRSPPKRCILPCARFYFSNLVLAIEFIHSHGVVHRDIKPDNLLIGADGYLMLADFGCAATLDQPYDWTFFGTRDWLSPEAVKGNVPKHMCHLPDWWAATVVLYELLTARMPFTPRQRVEAIIEHRILSGNVPWPNFDEPLDWDARNFINQMFFLQPEDRLGGKALMEGRYDEFSAELRAHPFLQPVDWKAVEMRIEEPPWVPTGLNPTLGWFSQGVVHEDAFPGLPVREPLIHQIFDRRRLHEDKEKSYVKEKIYRKTPIPGNLDPQEAVKLSVGAE